MKQKITIIALANLFTLLSYTQGNTNVIGEINNEVIKAINDINEIISTNNATSATNNATNNATSATNNATSATNNATNNATSATNNATNATNVATPITPARAAPETTAASSGSTNTPTSGTSATPETKLTSEDSSPFTLELPSVTSKNGKNNIKSKNPATSSNICWTLTEAFKYLYPGKEMQYYQTLQKNLETIQSELIFWGDRLTSALFNAKNKQKEDELFLRTLALLGKGVDNSWNSKSGFDNSDEWIRRVRIINILTTMQGDKDIEDFINNIGIITMLYRKNITEESEKEFDMPIMIEERKNKDKKGDKIEIKLS